MKISTLELAEKLIEKYETSQEMKSYPAILAYYALSLIADAAKDERLIKKCVEFLSTYPGERNHPQYNVCTYKVGGNGKAFMYMKGYMEDARKEVLEYAEMTINSPKEENGLLCMPSCPEAGKTWIDIITFTSPFCLYAGVKSKEEKYIDFAAEQCFMMYDFFMDKSNGLLHQAKGFLPQKNAITTDHWGRGNGWGLIALTELVTYLPVDSKHRKKAEEYFVNHVDAILPHQTRRGLWRQEIPEELSWDESTCTGLFAYCIGRGISIGLLEDEKYKTALEKAIKGICSFCITEDFSTHRVCPGCRCPGEGEDMGTPKAYITELTPCSNDQHSFGSLMMGMAGAYLNGIYEVEIGNELYKQRGLI